MRKHEQHRDKNKLATRADLIACVSFACLSLIAFALLVKYGRVAPLYGAMLAIVMYLLILTVWASFRRTRATIVSSDSLKTLLQSEFGATMTAISAPAFFMDGNGYLLWANEALGDLIGQQSLHVGTHVSDVFGDDCILPKKDGAEKKSNTISLFGSTYTYEIFKTPLRQKNAYFVILYDKTNEEAWRHQYEDERDVVVYIAIDNVDETLQSVQEEVRSKLLDVERVLQEWIDSMNGVLRAYERNRYVAIFRTACLREVCDNRFDILDKVRSVRVGDGMPFTVSIGVSDIEGTLSERDNAAQLALDMALLRGGDQAAYKSDDGVVFYGGKTKSGFKRTNIRARVVANQLSALMIRSDHVLIMGHRFGDFDSFGSAIGVARFAMSCGVNTHIVANLRDANLAQCLERIAVLPEYRGLFVDEAAGLDMLGPNVLLIVVDVNNFAHVESSELAARAEQIVVIDHHRKTAEYGKNVVLEYIEPSVSSTSELLAEMFQQHMPTGVLHPIEAELLMSGILLDTKQFTRNTGPRTFTAASFLRSAGANLGETNELFKGGLDDLRKESRFTSNVVLYRQRVAIAVCEGETDATYRVIAAKAADKLLNLRGIDAAFALVMIDGCIHISARSNGTINVQLVLERFHGGGHFDVAGAQVSDMTVQETVSLLRTAIDDQLQ